MVDYWERTEHPPTPAPGVEAPRGKDEPRLPSTTAVAVRGDLGNAQVNGDPRFLLLQRRFRLRASFMVATCLVWYVFYLLLSAFARDLMAVHVVGQLNLAMVLGLGQFASTFLLAWTFARFARRRLDPEAALLRAELDRADPARGRPLW
jgi:uncharacterized membrane protein (DUF485 family)